MASRIFPGKLLFLFLFLSSISAQENFFVPCGKIVSLNSELLNSLSSSCNYISPRTQQLKEILKTDFSTYDTCSILLNSILETGLYCEGVTQYSHFIKDSLIVKVLISFLRSDEQEIRNMAADFMTAYANPAHLNFYSYYIRENSVSRENHLCQHPQNLMSCKIERQGKTDNFRKELSSCRSPGKTG